MSNSGDQAPLPPSVVQSIEAVHADLRRRADPLRALERRRFETPWSPEAKARAEARSAVLTLKLDVFRDDLASVRATAHSLSAASAAIASEATRTAIFELRCAGETRRFTILSRAHADLAAIFMAQIERCESFRGRTSTEVLDAMKERSFEEFVAAMNRISQACAFEKERRG